MFQGDIEGSPSLGFCTNSRVNIVWNISFENALIETEFKHIFAFIIAMRRFVERLFKPISPGSAKHSVDLKCTDKPVSWLQTFWKDGEDAKNEVETSWYMDCRFILLWSSTCEVLSFIAGYTTNELRKAALLQNIEMKFFL